MTVVIILPTYNERENIQMLLTRLHTAVASVRNYKIKYLVVDDNSPDQTAQIVKDLQKSIRGLELVSGKKEGLGKALVRGMQYATRLMNADIIVQMDADLSHDPTVVPKLLHEIDKGADFVVGSRYIPGGSIPSNWGIHRKIFSLVGNAIVRIGLGFTSIHDWTGGFRAFKKQYFLTNAQHLTQFSGYVFQIAFLHRAVQQNAHVVEVPIHFTDRQFGRSKIAPSEYIRNVLVYVAKSRAQSIRSGPFGKFLVVGSIGFIINTVILELMVYFGFHPWAGSALGAECAIVSNFILNNNWTFRREKISRDRQIGKFFQFNLTSLGAVIIQSGTVAIGTVFLSVSLYRVWYIIGVGLGLMWNYWMYSHVIWKHTSH